VVHVCWYEADAWCRWAGRRLPWEGEWEVAASRAPQPGHDGLRGPRSRYPWGDEPPEAHHANLDAWQGGTVDVAAYAAGDSAYGCRQMMGNVWEWTNSEFVVYEGFSPDPYADYSAPWFDGNHTVLRGGSWATRGRIVWNTFRNFYTCDRRDVIAGFRTCAV
jgi:iron(II)-dependent oxidoreductase